MQFQPGHPPTPGAGRPRGAKNRLHSDFLDKLAKDFAEFGEKAIKIARIERPVEYLKIIASILPKEFIFADNTLSDLSDEELAGIMTLVQKMKADKRDEAPPDAPAVH